MLTLQRSGNVPANFRLDERTLQSTPRNPILLGWLKQSKDQKGQRFVRAISEGTRTMLHEMSEAHLPPPEYQVTDSETIVTLRTDPSRHERNSERASAFSNMYSVISNTVMSGDWRTIALSTLKDRLSAGGWYIDRLAHGRMTAHRRGTEFSLPDAVSKVIRLYPAYTMTFREIQKAPYLIVDYTVEVKSILSLAELERRGHSIAAFEGRRVEAKTVDGWQSGRIETVGEGAARVLFTESATSETIALNNIIPSLGIREVRDELKDVRFDLSTEIKKRSLASAIASARKRAETTHLTVQGLAERVFPLKVGPIELGLSSEPVRLDMSSGLIPRTLAEPVVEFDRKHETSNIRDGITQFGAYDHPHDEIELVPIVAFGHRSEMQALIERLKGGKFKYKGAERTFGVRFTYATIAVMSPEEGPLETATRILGEHQNWAGDSSLKRLFLIHVPEASFALDDATSPYYRTKRFLLEAGVPCQMVDTPTLINPDYKDLNLALNIAAKCGVVPWVLPEGMPDADFLVGLSYTQHRGDANTRLMGYANVFNRYGRWLFYSGNMHAFDYDDRTPRLAELVEDTLRRVENLSETPHVYFHYSARFSREDREALVAAARRVRPNGTYSFIWINSHHPIRLYDDRPESDGSLARGSYVVTTANQFYLSTTGYNPYRKVLGTPVPLEINVWRYAPSGHGNTPPDLHSLARQILALTKLNWASSDALTGEPITTKYAGDIAYLTAAFMRQGGTFKLHKALEQSPWFL